MKIVIFGGGGFIGSWIADRLLKDGNQLRIFEHPRVVPYRQFFASEKVEWVTGDMASMRDLATAVDGMDAVVHLVSTTLPKSSNDDPVYDVQSNLVPTLQLLQAMVAAQVRRIVFISSGGTVYGNPTYTPIDEAHPTDPLVSYGITKLAIEKYLMMYRSMHDIRTVILRVANPFGERQRIETAQGAIGVFLSRAMEGQPLEIWGDGSVTRDYLYIGDVAEAFTRALVYEGAQSIFNISSGAGTSLNDLIGILERVLGRPIVRSYRPARPFDVPVSVLDNSRAARELQWAPRMPIEDGIRRTAHWMQSQVGTGEPKP